MFNGKLKKRIVELEEKLKNIEKQANTAFISAGFCITSTPRSLKTAPQLRRYS